MAFVVRLFTMQIVLVKYRFIIILPSSRRCKDLPKELNTGIELGFIKEGYMRSSEVNGMVRKCNHSYLIRECEFMRPSECPTCQLTFFTLRHIVLSPSKEVLLWYKNYLLGTLHTNRKPLYEV